MFGGGLSDGPHAVELVKRCRSVLGALRTSRWDRGGIFDYKLGPPINECKGLLRRFCKG